MKDKIINLCSVLYWKIRLWLENQAQYKYYLRVFSDVSKIRDIKTNLLTKEQKLKIDNFYKSNYGKKVSYMWHNLIMSYNNKFDVRYLPPEIFLKIIDKLNTRDIKYSIFYDKNFFHNFVKKTGIKTPEKIFYSINGLFFDSADNIISKQDLYKQLSNIGEVFIKPTQQHSTGYGKNCRLVNISDNIDIYSKTNIKDMIEQYYNKDFVVQKKIICHKTISDVYSKSANTFSVYSFILNNEVNVLNKIIFKIGMGKSTTDYSGIKQEGLIIGINNDGTLFDSALCVKRDKWYNAHPDTGVIFKNYRIENFHKITDTVKKLHSLIPWLKFCKWDVTLDLDGTPVLIEVERPSEMFQQQILYKEGFFGEYTEELLSLLKSKN